MIFFIIFFLFSSTRFFAQEHEIKLYSYLTPEESWKIIGKIPSDFIVKIGEKKFIQNFSNNKENDFIYLKEHSVNKTSHPNSFSINNIQGQTIIIKTGLNYNLNYPLPGGGWEISTERAQRSIQISSFYKEMGELNQYHIPNTLKKWSYFEENTAIQQRSENWTIIKEVPLDIGVTDYIPFSNLNSNELKKLHLSSNQRNYFSFAWHEIVHPLVEFLALIDFQNGLRMELSLDNLFLRIDRTSNEIKGIAISDLDVHSIDYLKRLQNNYTLPKEGLTYDASRMYGYAEVVKNRALGYETLKFSVVKNLLRDFLNKEEFNLLIKNVDELILERFNESFHTAISNVELISSEYKKVFSNDLEFKKLQEMKNSAIWQEQLFNKASSFSFYLQEKLCNHFFL